MVETAASHAEHCAVMLFVKMHRRQLRVNPLIVTYHVPEAPQGRVPPDTAAGRHHRPSATCQQTVYVAEALETPRKTDNRPASLGRPSPERSRLGPLKYGRPAELQYAHDIGRERRLCGDRAAAPARSDQNPLPRAGARQPPPPLVQWHRRRVPADYPTGGRAWPL
eukprot:4317539-Prymnesium_polylepis.2